MQTSELVYVKLSAIDPNPMRQLKRYPFDKAKIDSLRQSIKDVGLWEGVIARKVGTRYQQAFGHHRIEAARKELGEDHKVPIIVRNLDDKEMLQFMGRENLEDYNANFMVMLETWEAAVGFLRRDRAANLEAVDIAAVLGWVTIPQYKKSGDLAMKDVAQACSAAARLIAGGHLKRVDLTDLSVDAVRQLTQRMIAQIETLERMGRQTQRPAKEIEKAKATVGTAGQTVARDIREGRVASRDIRGRVDIESMRAAGRQEKPSPLFSSFGRSLVATLDRMLDTDTVGIKLSEIKDALKVIETDEDISVVSDVSYACGKVEKRAAKWRQTFENPTKRVVKLKEIG